MNSNNGQAIKIGIIAAVLLVLAVGGFYFEFRNNNIPAGDSAVLRKQLADCEAGKTVAGGICERDSANNDNNSAGIAMREADLPDNNGAVLLGDRLNAEQAVKKAVDYVNKNMLANGAQAAAEDVAEESGIYKFKLVIQGKNYNGYVTKDGKLFFADGIPAAIKLDEPVNNGSGNQSGAVKKTSRPDVKLFVMSYCPYGLQAEKMYLPVYDLLKGKADMGIYFVNYAMHGKKEIDENLRQYCIQKEQGGKFSAYLECFVAGSVDNEGNGPFGKCLAQTGIDQGKLGNCIAAADKLFKVADSYNDKNSWISGSYPKFMVDDGLNSKYGIQGSPAVVINDSEVQISVRSPQKFLESICAAFINPPLECKDKIDDKQVSTGFGTGNSAEASGGCGG